MNYRHIKLLGLLIVVTIVLLIVSVSVPIKNKTLTGCRLKTNEFRTRYSLIGGEKNKYDNFNDITGDELYNCAHSTKHKISLYLL
jgi:hypothetical protein